MSTAERIRLWLGWCPMVLSRNYEIEAVEDENRSVHPPDAPFRAVPFKRMDYYRNQILARNALMTLVLVNFVFVYPIVWVGGIWDGPVTGGKVMALLLVGPSIGFGYGIYEILKNRERLFKEGKLTIGYKIPRTHRYRIFNFLLRFAMFLGILLGLTYFLGVAGFFLAIFSFGCSYLIVQWAWYLDLTREERKQNKKFIWKSQRWFRQVVVEPVNKG